MFGVTLVEESNYVLKNIEDIALSDITKKDTFIEELSTDTFDFDTNTFFGFIGICRVSRIHKLYFCQFFKIKAAT